MKKCGYAEIGTYGHECGKPATLASQKDSEHTADGKYWAFRCAECAKKTGRDNWGFSAWVPAAPDTQVNVWR